MHLFITQTKQSSPTIMYKGNIKKSFNKFLVNLCSFNNAAPLFCKKINNSTAGASGAKFSYFLTQCSTSALEETPSMCLQTQHPQTQKS